MGRSVEGCDLGIPSNGRGTEMNRKRAQVAKGPRKGLATSQDLMGSALDHRRNRKVSYLLRLV